jgi:GT2 family glycosyltransferase
LILSFLIPTKNRPDDLEANILAISNLNLKGIEYEILVLDDGSTTDYAKVVSGYKFVEYYKNESSLGISSVRNKLASLANGKYLIFLDDDVQIDKNLNLNILFELFESNTKLALIAFNITAILSSDYYLKSESNTVNVNQKSIKQIPFNKYHTYFDSLLTKKVNYVSYFIGAAFACRKSLFDENIYFDELFLWGNEELDFSYNIIKHNYELIFHPEFRATHFPKKSVIDHDENNLNSLNLFIANRILTAYKNLSLAYAISYIFIWTTYYLLLSIIKFRLRDWFIGIKLGIRKSKQSIRNPLSKEQMLYLKNNFGRIFY